MMIVRAPATPIATFFGFFGRQGDGLVYRIECVVDQGRTTQFEEQHTAEGGFESIKIAQILKSKFEPRQDVIACSCE